jgi:hypothetical protein
VAKTCSNYCWVLLKHTLFTWWFVFLAFHSFLVYVRHLITVQSCVRSEVYILYEVGLCNFSGWLLVHNRRKSHDIHTKFHYDPLNTSTVWKAAVLILFMGGIYIVRRSVDIRLHDVHTEFQTIRSVVQAILLLTSTIWETETGDICEVRRWDGLKLH